LDGVIAKARLIAVARGEVGITKASIEEKRYIGLGDDCCLFLIKF